MKGVEFHGFEHNYVASWSRGSTFDTVQSMVEPPSDLPIDDSLGIEDGKSVKGRSGLGEFVCSIDHVGILGNTKVLDVEGEV